VFGGEIIKNKLKTMYTAAIFIIVLWIEIHCKEQSETGYALNI